MIRITGIINTIIMSSKRKSHRNKKNVNYTDSNSNYESDEDFENEFEPPSKKVKNKVFAGKDARKQEKNERKSPKQRLSIDEKLYQRDIETALKISVSNSTSTNEQDVADKGKTKLPREEDSDYDPQEQSTAGYESEDDSCEDEKENDSDFSEDDLKKTISKKKKTSKTKCTENNERKLVGSNKQTPVAKEKEKQNVVVPETTNMSSNQKATCRAKKPSTKSRNAGKPTSVVNRNLSSLGLGGVLIKNPGPPIRVGLSRNIKVKPLHSKVSVPH